MCQQTSVSHNSTSLLRVCFVGVYQVVDTSKRISDVPEWFKGARLNYAENLLKHPDQDKVALYAASKCAVLIERCVMPSCTLNVGLGDKFQIVTSR